MENNLLDNQDITPVRDLGPASYLMASRQVKLKSVNRTNRSIVYFNFTPKLSAEKLISDYWSGKAKPIQPKELFSSLRDLKDILFSGT